MEYGNLLDLWIFKINEHASLCYAINYINYQRKGCISE